MEAELMINITEHEVAMVTLLITHFHLGAQLVPEHIVMTADEKADLLAR